MGQPLLIVDPDGSSDVVEVEPGEEPEEPNQEILPRQHLTSSIYS